VRTKRKPAEEWVVRPSRTVRHLPGFTPGARRIPLGAMGGRADRGVAAAGFFRTVKQGGRWWLADPEGRLFLHVGMCSTAPGNSKKMREALASRFGDAGGWAAAAVALLGRYGFNGTGGWSAVDLLRGSGAQIAYTPSWNFMAGFGREKKLTFQQPGHMGYPGDCIPVFHPEFPAFCDGYAKQLGARKDDPLLLGHYSDNELPGPAEVLVKALALDASNPALAPARDHARQWLAARKGSAEAGAADLTAEDREAFREHLFDEYYRITTGAIRRYDPTHLCLGSRLNGSLLKSPGVLRAAGRRLDAVAVNVYGVWTPSADLLDGWRQHLGKPVIVTEFYAKGDDAGFSNTSGAGWIVPTQSDRAVFYQNFVLGMIESRLCVGWHWFKYQDNDPDDLTTDPSNRDSNKGIVNIRYEPYAKALEGMGELNRDVYALADYFDKR
jgi:hypothetical protein